MREVTRTEAGGERPTVGSRLRAARERRGWSRETLAHHAGVSWSAIAQIETGRRRQVRPATLLALGGALGISVEYLLGTPATGAGPVLHAIAPYRSQAELTAVLDAFVRQGAERAEPTLAVVGERCAEVLGGVALRAELDVTMSESPDAVMVAGGGVQLHPIAGWTAAPADHIRRLRAFVECQLAAGAPGVRFVGEAFGSPRAPADIGSWLRMEALLNVLFCSQPVRILCPYDAEVVPAAVVERAHALHPEVASAGGIEPVTDFEDPASVLLRDAPLL
jgi:transcriptional regulator with XRE-family HTH domain